MKIKNLYISSFRQLGRELGLKVELFDGRLVVIAPLWRQALSTESPFCKALVACGYLTERQMLHAARRYRLGATLKGGVIFWQIDAEEDIYDGKVMYYREDCHRDHERHPTWVSTMLKRRYKWPDADRLTTRHCLFGLHLLSQPENNYDTSLSVVCVVESEKTAVIAAGLMPKYLWLATGGKSGLNERLNVLRGRKVVAWPDVDGFQEWTDKLAGFEGLDITVSPLLQQVSTPEDFAAHIDIADWLVRSKGTAHGDEHRIQSKNFLRAARFLAPESIAEVEGLIDDLELEFLGAEKIDPPPEEASTGTESEKKPE